MNGHGMDMIVLDIAVRDSFIGTGEAVHLVFLFAQRFYDSDPRNVLTHDAYHGIQFLLHDGEHGDALGRHEQDDAQQERDHDDEDQGQLKVHGHRHDQTAGQHDRRTNAAQPSARYNCRSSCG